MGSVEEMTLQEAIKSGKPFKRPCWSAYYITAIESDLFKVTEYGETKTVAALRLYLNDLIADDYLLIHCENTHILNKNL